eukprot:2868247-Rhodomonas_salina.1
MISEARRGELFLPDWGVAFGTERVGGTRLDERVQVNARITTHGYFAPVPINWNDPTFLPNALFGIYSILPYVRAHGSIPPSLRCDAWSLQSMWRFKAILSSGVRRALLSSQAESHLIVALVMLS